MRILDELSHNLQLPVLEPLVLQDLFDSYDFPSLHNSRLKDHTKRPVANNSFRGVRDLLLAIGGTGSSGAAIYTSDGRGSVPAGRRQRC